MKIFSDIESIISNKVGPRIAADLFSALINETFKSQEVADLSGRLVAAMLAHLDQNGLFHAVLSSQLGEEIGHEILVEIGALIHGEPAVQAPHRETVVHEAGVHEQCDAKDHR